MNVLLSADCLYPAQLGGPSNTIYWQAKALSRIGHTVTVIATSYCLPPTVPRDRWLIRDWGRVIYTRNPHFYLPIKHCWYGWRAIRKADIIHINSLFYPASLVWVILCRMVGKPVVWSPHGELDPAALSFRRVLKRCIIRIIRWLSASISFHATSMTEAESIRTHFGFDKRIVIIPNRMELPEAVTTELSERPYILFIGRLHPIKAIDRLVEAVSQSQVFMESDYTLLIAGPVADKAYERTLKALVEKKNLSAKVSFTGAVLGAQKQTLYASARLTILPSHAENFGNVVIESLAQGTPVVASVNTPWQLLERERVGSWVANEPHVLRQAIDRYLTMTLEEYNGFRERARLVVRQQFDVLENGAEWAHFYEQVLEKHRFTRTGQLDGCH